MSALFTGFTNDNKAHKLRRITETEKKRASVRAKKIERNRIKRKQEIYSPSKLSSRHRLLINPTFKVLAAPENLTLKFEDANGVLNLIKRIHRYASRGYHIDLHLSSVKDIAEGAISMLLSVISDLERSRVYFRGQKPEDEECRSILEKSGFFNHMKGIVEAKNKVSKNKILRTGTLETHQEEMTPEIHKAMETVWGKKSRCPLLYGGIGEMMRNSCDHAFTNKNNVVWHLGISHFESSNTVKFSFVDNGEGIISTYYNKGMLKKIRGYFRDDVDVLESAFRNGIESRTGLKWRGKGLPTIFEMYDEDIIKNLVVITNNAYLDFDRNIFKKIGVSFSGTYYFWKIDSSCKPHFFDLN